MVKARKMQKQARRESPKNNKPNAPTTDKRHHQPHAQQKAIATKQTPTKEETQRSQPHAANQRHRKNKHQRQKQQRQNKRTCTQNTKRKRAKAQPPSNRKKTMSRAIGAQKPYNYSLIKKPTSNNHRPTNEKRHQLHSRCLPKSNETRNNNNLCMDFGNIHSK